MIYDLFTEFGVSRHSEIDFDLDNASPAPGAVKKKCHDIRRKIEDEPPACSRRPDLQVLRAKPAGWCPYDHIHAMCGPDF